MESSFDIFSFFEYCQQYDRMWDNSLPVHKDQLEQDQAVESLLSITGLENIKA